MIAAMGESRDIARAAEVVFLKGWAEASAGNMSLRLSGLAAVPQPASDPGMVHECDSDMSPLEGERFLVTASGSRMRDLARDPGAGLCLVEILDRRRYRILEGSGRLTSEWATHARLHALFKQGGGQERAVLHCHPLGLIALSHLFRSEGEMNERLFRMHHETRLFLPGMLGMVPFVTTGSMMLADETREKMERFRVVIWKKHGVIASGGSLDEALDRIEMVEKAAAIYLQLRSAGLEPEGLSDEQVEETLRLVKK